MHLGVAAHLVPVERILKAALSISHRCRHGIAVRNRLISRRSQPVGYAPRQRRHASCGSIGGGRRPLGSFASSVVPASLLVATLIVSNFSTGQLRNLGMSSSSGPSSPTVNQRVSNQQAESRSTVSVAEMTAPK